MLAYYKLAPKAFLFFPFNFYIFTIENLLNIFKWLVQAYIVDFAPQTFCHHLSFSDGKLP